MNSRHVPRHALGSLQPASDVLRPDAYRPLVSAFCDGTPYNGESRQGLYQRAIMLLSLHLYLDQAAVSSLPRTAGVAAASAGRRLMRRLLIVTPCVPGGLPTQGTVLAEHLRDEGVVVTVLSRARSSMGRVVDVFTRGSWLVARHDVVLVDIFAERAFVYESFAILCRGSSGAASSPCSTAACFPISFTGGHG